MPRRIQPGPRLRISRRLVLIGLCGAFIGGFALGAFSGRTFTTVPSPPADATLRSDQGASAAITEHQTESVETEIASARPILQPLVGHRGEEFLAPRPEIHVSSLAAPSQSLASAKDDATATLETLPDLRTLDIQPPDVQTKSYVVERGDTLVDILLRAGLEPDHAHHALTALSDVYDPRTLRPGQELRLALSSPRGDDHVPELQKLVLNLDFENELQLVSSGGAFQAAKQSKILDRRTMHSLGVIDDSLYVAAAEKAVPTETILDLVRLFSWDVDFQRDIQSGHGFEIIYEELIAPGTDQTRGGPILYAKLDLGEQTLEAYRFENTSGEVGYYDAEGKSVRKQFMRTPIEGARLSSGFGKRRHPILGYTKMHKGVDFAAPTGTPIFAAGDGTVEVAGRNGGYGHYVRIRHNGEFSTAYAHLSRYAKGMGPGKKVKQGQVIGYVGSTGRSTGPHLHYEVIRNGNQVNPLSLRSDVVEKLEGAELATFKSQIRDIVSLKDKTGEKHLLARRVQL